MPTNLRVCPPGKINAPNSKARIRKESGRDHQAGRPPKGQPANWSLDDSNIRADCAPLSQVAKNGRLKGPPEYTSNSHRAADETVRIPDADPSKLDLNREGWRILHSVESGPSNWQTIGHAFHHRQD